MITPVRERGIEAGKVYVITGSLNGNRINTSSSNKVGDMLVLAEDDGTHLPFFNQVDAQGAVINDRIVVNLLTLSLAEVGSNGRPKPSAGVSAFRLVQTGDKTTFEIDRSLTAEELAQLLKIAEVK